MSADYWLGLATLPAIAVLLALDVFIYAASQKTRRGVECDSCRRAGWRRWKMEIGEHNSWALWHFEFVHRFRLKTRRHREAWMYEELPWVVRDVESGRMTAYKADRLRSRYGTR